MWPGTANSGGGRSPQASAGTPNNTREPARSDKKKPQPRTVGVLLLVGRGNLKRLSIYLKYIIKYRFDIFVEYHLEYREVGFELRMLGR